MRRLLAVALPTLSLLFWMASCEDTTGLSGGPNGADGSVDGPPPGDGAASDGANGGDDGGGGDASCPAPTADPAFLSDAVEIDTSGHFVCAVRVSGQVVCWGENLHAQLGITAPADGGPPDAGTTFSSRGIVVPGVTGATHVGAGYQHACAVVAGGGVWCWGNGENEQTGFGGTTATPPSQVLSSGFTPLTNATAIAAGGAFTCVVSQGGGVQCWGENSKGQLGTPSAPSGGDPRVVPGLGGAATTLTAGFFHACVMVGGVAKCWGGSANGELGVKPGPVDGSAPGEYPSGATVARIVASSPDTCVVDTNGNVVCSGYNLSGELGATNASGEIDSPFPIPELSNGGVLDIDIGWAHSCGVRTNGTAFCMSGSPLDALGRGPLDASSSDNAALPVLDPDGGVLPLASVASMKVGGGGYGGTDQHSCAIVKPACAKSGQVWCWGANSVGQLGDGTTTPRSLPVRVLAPL